MTSTSETGHPKIVSNFETLIASCLSYGTVYNPSKNALKIPQLQAALATAKNTLQTVKTTLAAFENTRNARELAIAPAPIKKLSTRIVNALEATDASKLTVNDAKTINRKIQGKRAEAAAPSTPVFSLPQFQVGRNCRW